MLSFTEWPFTGGSVPLLLQFLSFLKCHLSNEWCLSNHLIPATVGEAQRDKQVTSLCVFYSAVMEGLAFLGGLNNVVGALCHFSLCDV